MGEIMDIAVHFPLFSCFSSHLLIFSPEQSVTVMSHRRNAAGSTCSIGQKAADSPDNGRQLIVSPVLSGPSVQVVVRYHCLVHLVYQRCKATQCI